MQVDGLVISRVISRVTIVNLFEGTYSSLITTHEPPSSQVGQRGS